MINESRTIDKNNNPDIKLERKVKNEANLKICSDIPVVYGYSEENYNDLILNFDERFENI